MPTCVEQNCGAYACFNYAEEKAQYCKAHKKLGMIDVKHKRCRHLNCDKNPSYNMPGETIALFCAKHKKSDMIDVVCKRCNDPNCDKVPNFNLPGKKGGLFCAKHKRPDMINVKNRCCNHSNCNKRPTFNMPGERVGIFCTQHKLFNMIDVLNKRCNHPNCNKVPNFNLPGKHTGLFCAEHKPIGMINVTHKICSKSNCDTIAVFGYLGNSVTRCAKHKFSGMIKNPNKKCIICKTKARYITDSKSFYCDIHKPNQSKEIGDVCIICCVDINHGETMCKTCIEYQKRGYTLKRGLKEQTIKKLLDKEDDLNDYIHDSTISDGCLNRRPDFRFHRNFNTVILEVDEHQHRQYNCSCETSRMKNLYHANGEPNMTIIRYNPDNYKPTYGLVWNQANRHGLLKNIIREECNATEDRPHGIKVIYLFYDGFSELDIHVDWINPYSIEK